MNSYDEIKSLLKASKNLLREQEEMKSDSIESEKKRKKEGKHQRYKINGYVLSLYGDTEKETTLTNIEKTAFIDTLKEFTEEVADLVDFDDLKLKSDSAEWSGRITNHEITFIYILGENEGVYFNGELVELDDDTYDILGSLKSYFDKFSAKWGPIINERKELKI